MTAFTLFDTAVGSVAIAWGDHGIVRILLPSATPALTRKALLGHVPDAVETAPPKPIAKAIAAMTALLAGSPVDLSSIVLDDRSLSPFYKRVYEIARAIPVGNTLTYGEVATKAGAPGGARAVGQAMGNNPFPPVVPCHRVLAAGNKIGGFSAPGGAKTKQRMLAIERGEALLFPM